MPSEVALILCVALVAVLLYIESRRKIEVSLTLWVPTVWMLIYASRPLSKWFLYAPVSFDANTAITDVGSPLDRYVLSTLIILALLILFKRKIEWSRILKDNFWLILIFLYMGMSIAWSEILFTSFRRWIRASGEIVIALVILSERMPHQALESVFRRCAYVLIPFSLVLIKFFPRLGVAYGHWSGGQMWIGVTQQKNGLGQLCLLSVFVLTFALIKEWRSGNLFKDKSQTFGDALIITIGIFMLRGPGDSASATSVFILIMGIAILLLLFWRENLARFIAAHLKTIIVFLVSLYLLFYESLLQIITPLLNRDTTLTGRTDIWKLLLDFSSRNPLFGVGYGGFWAPGNTKLEEYFTTNFIIAQAHNGYLAIYVELGIVGIVLLALFILSFCNRVRRELNYAFEWGVFGICFLLMSLLYNNTEISFIQSQSHLWSTMVFLTVVFSEPYLNQMGNCDSKR
jgi:exopolysaccharide production protein ExoQ